MKALITGLAGSGKTTVAAKLNELGYKAYNMDSVEGLCAWVNIKTGEVAPDNRETIPGWLDSYNWLWDEQKLRELLNEPGDAYFCGSSGNQEQFYPLFDRLFLLETYEELIRDRIFNNERDHTYGRRPGELEAILGYYEAEQDKAKAAGATVIKADQPIGVIVGLILAETGQLDPSTTSNKIV